MFYNKTVNKKNNKKTGDLGEDIAEKHLKNKGFSILARNYGKKYGEIDIVARETRMMGDNDSSNHNLLFSEGGDGLTDLFNKKAHIVHFVEVKSVSYGTKEDLNWAVSHETHRPEEKVHHFKLNQIRKAAETWISENKWEEDSQVDVVTVRMVKPDKYAQVKHIQGVIAE